MPSSSVGVAETAMSFPDLNWFSTCFRIWADNPAGREPGSSNETAGGCTAAAVERPAYMASLPGALGKPLLYHGHDGRHRRNQVSGALLPIAGDGIAPQPGP